MNGVERTVKIGDTLVHGVEIDWEKRDLKRIYTPEEDPTGLSEKGYTFVSEKSLQVK